MKTRKKKTISKKVKECPGRDMPADQKTWSTDDIDWDENCCLFIKNLDLADLVEKRIKTGEFCISRKNRVRPTQKTNIQCPC